MAKDKGKSSKTNVTARAQDRAASSRCNVCGNKVEVVMRVNSTGRRTMAKVCCEKAGVAVAA